MSKSNSLHSLNRNIVSHEDGFSIFPDFNGMCDERPSLTQIAELMNFASFSYRKRISGVFAGELDYVRETNIDEVKKWLNEGIIRLAFPSRDLEKFNDVVMTATSPILKIRASYWQSGYD